MHVAHDKWRYLRRRLVDGWCLSMTSACCRLSLADTQYGSFVGPKTVRVDGAEYTADHILVAVGGRPTMPPMEGGELCIDSNGFFLLEVRCTTHDV